MDGKNFAQTKGNFNKVSISPYSIRVFYGNKSAGARKPPFEDRENSTL